jgi:hypothetical protein
MATTTPNFGWDIPQSTDLVKDGATAIAALGTDIDTALVDLKGGTTGQVLSKNSNTDLDFTWVAQDDSNAIQNALLTTTGDTIYASGASTPARLGIGTTGQVLTVSGGIPSWATPAGASANWTLVNSGGTLLTGSTTTVSGISGADKIMVLVGAPSTGYSTDSTQDVYIRLNTDSANNYYNFGAKLDYPATYGANNMQSTETGGASFGIFIGRPNAAASYGGAYCLISGCNTSGVKVFNGAGSFQYSGSSGTGSTYILGGYYNSSSTITSVSVFTSFSTNFDAGRVYVYTSA